MDIHIFKTNITSEKTAQNLQNLLAVYFPISSIKFEIKKMSSLLKIESKNVQAVKIKNTLNDFGYSCEKVT